jgi:cytochrome c
MRYIPLILGGFALLWAASGQTQSVPAGKELFERRCTGCHALDRDKEGPRLGGVYGRAAASVPSFNYSDALKNSRIVWNADSLDKWLTDPAAMVPGNDMAFHVESAAERSALIEYLRQAKP